jgi:hypothetical protein
MIFRRLRNLWRLSRYTLGDEHKKGLNPYLVEDIPAKPRGRATIIDLTPENPLDKTL